eukprot:jgi/Galph1/5491/GphlegSOOS_G4155.1
MNETSSEEKAIQQTNEDATLSKYCSVSKGYYRDPYIGFFIQSKSKRQPLINRGTFARVYAVQSLIEKFLSCTTAYRKRQIINLGAGFDTLFFRLKEKGLFRLEDMFLELDYPEVTRTKAHIIRKHSKIFKGIDNSNHQSAERGSDLSGEYYALVGIDIRQLERLPKILNDCHVSKEAPTLVLSECVLTYIEPQVADSILVFFSNHFQWIEWVLFELTFPKDPFGQQMVKNIEERGFSLNSLTCYHSLESQKERFARLGYPYIVVDTMASFYDNILDKHEKRRIEQLEWLDELEEWKLLMQHYFLLICFKTHLPGK